MDIPLDTPQVGYPHYTPPLELVFGETCFEVAAAGVELVGASAGLSVDRVIATAIAAASHRERVLPARHVRLELGGRMLELRAQP